MSTLMRVRARLGGLFLGAATSVTLVVGVAEARFIRLESGDCLYHPPTFLGSCTGNAHCQDMCNQQNPPPVLDECGDGCCSCVI
jgi:hypothetical protein